MISKQILTSALAALIIGLNASCALGAQSYPSKPIKIIVPLPPGGGVDATARVVADRLSRAFGKPVHVENRPGSGATIGNEAAARSPADGHTILITSDSVTSTAHVL